MATPGHGHGHLPIGMPSPAPAAATAHLKITEALALAATGTPAAGAGPSSSGNGSGSGSGGPSPSPTDNGSAAQPTFSFEFFPPKSTDGIDLLKERISRMCALEPLFVDVTHSTGEDGFPVTLQTAVHAQKFGGVPGMVHLCGGTMSARTIRQVLRDTKAAGIRNVLALRGDCAPGTKFSPVAGGLPHASDLVKLIREHFGPYFCVGVAGYPDGHPDDASFEAGLDALQEKVNAGADFIVTQVVLDLGRLKRFVDAVRARGITVPILPGIVVFQNYRSFLALTQSCRLSVPATVRTAMARIMHDNNKVADFGIELAKQLAVGIFDMGLKHVHFFTMNLESSIRVVLRDLHCTCEEGVHPCRRRYPWRPSADAGRERESVRPIFWAMRPESYVLRTEGWQQYPQGHWGESQSHSFQDLTRLSDTRCGTREERRAMWGEAPLGLADIMDVFVGYLNGSVRCLPWCYTALHPESSSIRTNLVDITRCGFLTINSQPRLAGVPSDDPVYGWGGSGGVVYQKAYVECFVSPVLLAALMECAQCASEFPSITFMAVDRRGNSYSNARKSGANAVTWGVFPSKEVQQPTVVDADAFAVWKDEAFGLWNLWADIYDPDTKSGELLSDISDKYYLLNVVDNDFIRGDVYEIFRRAYAATQAHASSQRRPSQQPPLAASMQASLVPMEPTAPSSAPRMSSSVKGVSFYSMAASTSPLIESHVPVVTPTVLRL